MACSLQHAIHVIIKLTILKSYRIKLMNFQHEIRRMLDKTFAKGPAMCKVMPDQQNIINLVIINHRAVGRPGK